jgi:hypothetical protein
VKLRLVIAGIFLFFVCGATELPETLARFGNIDLKSTDFKGFDIPAEPAQRRAVLKKLVDTQIYLIIVRRLLQHSGIAPDALTAGRYVAMRKRQFPGKQTEAFFRELEKKISQPEFQLKSALFFTFYAADKSTVEPTEAEIRQHYELNREKSQLPVKSDLALFRAGGNDSSGKEKAGLILARLRQGEDFYSLAKKFDPQGREKGMPHAPELQPYFKGVKDLGPGMSKAFETPRGIFIVKVLSRSPKAYTPFESARPYITEMLSSARLKNSLEQYMREMIAKTPVQYFF